LTEFRIVIHTIQEEFVQLVQQTLNSTQTGASIIHNLNLQSMKKFVFQHLNAHGDLILNSNQLIIGQYQRLFNNMKNGFKLINRGEFSILRINIF